MIASIYAVHCELAFGDTPPAPACTNILDEVGFEQVQCDRVFGNGSTRANAA